MAPSLDSLKITASECDRLCGLEVGELFVGGMIGGGYRSSVFRDPKRLGLFGLTQIVGLGLLVMLSLPIGLLASRAPQTPVQRISLQGPFLGVVAGVSGLGFVGWNAWMIWRSRQLRTLSRLLDEVDRYHQVVQVLELYDALQELPQGVALLGDAALGAAHRPQVLEALQLTRASLVTALQAERLLRQNQRLLAQRSGLMIQLAQNLHTLTALEVQQQAQESAQVLAEVLEIGQALRSLLPNGEN